MDWKVFFIQFISYICKYIQHMYAATYLSPLWKLMYLRNKFITNHHYNIQFHKSYKNNHTYNVHNVVLNYSFLYSLYLFLYFNYQAILTVYQNLILFQSCVVSSEPIKDHFFLKINAWGLAQIPSETQSPTAV